MPRGGHFGKWVPLPKDHFKSRWKHFYKRCYREKARGVSPFAPNRPDNLPPYAAASKVSKTFNKSEDGTRTDEISTTRFVHHDIMPSPWRLQYSALNFPDGGMPNDLLPPHNGAFKDYRENVQVYMKPYRHASASSSAQDAILRCLDSGRRGRNDSGLGRVELETKLPQDGADEVHHVPSHIANLLKAHSSEGSGAETLAQLMGPQPTNQKDDQPQSFVVRQLYALCEEKQIVWDGKQMQSTRGRPQKQGEEQTGPDRGRFPRVDEQASMVDDFHLMDILKLRHKTNRRCHPKWVAIEYQFKKWRQQYLRRRHMNLDEAKARMGIISQAVE